jgi:hypothetical protein
MKVIRSINAWYPTFHLGCDPGAVPCQLSIVEANGRRYLKTPFAMLDSFAADDAERQIGRGYFATAAECNAHIEREYPQWRRAVPIMDALCKSMLRSTLTGPADLADKLDCSLDQLYKIARGHAGVHKLSRYLDRLNSRNDEPAPNQMAY